MGYRSMIRTDMLGGAYVRRAFNKGDVRLQPGATLTTEQLMSIPKTNRRALIEQGFLETWPAIPDTVAKAPVTTQPQEGGERHVVSRGNKFDVIEGVKLNDKPLSREDAAALAAAGKKED